MKFGGSSLADAHQVHKVFEIVRARQSQRPVVVCSAHKGVTDLLINAARTASRGQADAAAIIDKQRSILKALGAPSDMLDGFFAELSDLLRGISLVREVSPRVLDYVQSFGERMSVRAVAHYFNKQGLKARAFDAFELGFITDQVFNKARPVGDYEARMRSAFDTHLSEDTVAVITGFVGKSESGEITTVGRNGSDFTAACFAAGLGAKECQIWTDTDGVMTADPSVLQTAKNIPSMSFAEASELAYYGSRVLHPATLLPSVKRNVPVRVLNTNRPDHPGTVITAEGSAEDAPAVTSIAYKENQTVITVESTQMLMQHGFLAKLFESIAHLQISIGMISTSEVSVSMTSGALPDPQAVVDALGALGRVRIATEKTIVCVVGSNIKQRQGLGAVIFQALDRANVNVEMISHGANNINLSLLIDDSAIGRAVPALHEALF